MHMTNMLLSMCLRLDGEGRVSQILCPQGIHSLGYILSSEYNITRDILGEKKLLRGFQGKGP